MVITRYLGYDGDNSTHPLAAPSDTDYYISHNILGPGNNYYIQTSRMVYNYYLYIARLIIEHPREWLASLAG